MASTSHALATDVCSKARERKRLGEHEHERLRKPLADGQLIDRANQGLWVNAEVSVEIGDRSRLPEVFDAVRNGPMTSHAAER